MQSLALTFREAVLPAAPRTIVLLLLVVLGTGACGLRSHDRTDDRQGRVFTEAQIQRSGATNAWDALRRLGTNLSLSETPVGRPRTATRRGAGSIALSSAPTVLLDGVRSDFAALQKVPADRILEIRILNGVDGTARYGTGAGNGVIVVTTR